MRDVLQEYIHIFSKALNLPGICWWIIDYEENPDYFYCNELMKETFSLDKKLECYSVADNCPIAGDYNKNIEIASNSEDIAKKIFEDYAKLINQESNEYCNTFPYFNKVLNKTMYFSSRALVVEKTKTNNVSILYGIIEDITVLEEQNSELKRLNKELQELSVLDTLTGLYNRRKFNEIILSEMNRYERTKQSFGIMLLDIDFFKKVNDTYGHLVGDEVLIKIATLLKTSIRKIDKVFRWGGEEFLIICPQTNLKGILHLAESIKNIVKEYEFDIVKRLTISLGVSIAQEDDTLDSILNRVDKYLYKAKELGAYDAQTGHQSRRHPATPFRDIFCDTILP